MFDIAPNKSPAGERRSIRHTEAASETDILNGKLVRVAASFKKNLNAI